MNKLLKILWILMLSLAIIAIGFYVYQFWTRPLSESPEQWGQFWDYIWWILNPIIGLSNLCVLIWLSLSIAKIEEWREISLLEKQVKPFLRVDIDANANNDGIYEDLFFRIKNSWLLPLVFKKIEIIGKNGESYKDFSYIRDNKIPPGWYSHIYFYDDDWILGEWESVILFSIIKSENNIDPVYINKTAKIISDYILKFNYEDIYWNEFTKEKNLAKSLEFMNLK